MLLLCTTDSVMIHLQALTLPSHPARARVEASLGTHGMVSAKLTRRQSWDTAI